ESLTENQPRRQVVVAGIVVGVEVAPAHRVPEPVDEPALDRVAHHAEEVSDAEKWPNANRERHPDEGMNDVGQIPELAADQDVDGEIKVACIARVGGVLLEQSDDDALVAAQLLESHAAHSDVDGRMRVQRRIRVFVVQSVHHHPRLGVESGDPVPAGDHQPAQQGMQGDGLVGESSVVAHADGKDVQQVGDGEDGCAEDDVHDGPQGCCYYSVSSLEVTY